MAVENFGVKKFGKKEKITARINELAKPNNPREPIEKLSPREKNIYGLPIYPMPLYGRVFPNVKPFKERSCDEFFREKVEKEIGEKLKRQKEKELAIDSIAFKDSIDPYFDPVAAKRQLNARKKLKKIIEAKINREKKKIIK